MTQKIRQNTQNRGQLYTDSCTVSLLKVRMNVTNTFQVSSAGFVD